MGALVLADSTVDFHNWTADGEWTGWATAELVEAFARRNVCATVDSVCGSGFVARAREGEHFYARLSQHLRNDGYRGPVLLVGGWNDVRAGRSHDAAQAIRMCTTTLERFNGIR